MTKATRYFLLTFRVADRSVAVEAFGADETAATDAYSRLEREVGDHGEVEVVLVGADSIETVRKTHSHYFSADEDVLASVEKNLLVVASR